MKNLFKSLGIRKKTGTDLPGTKNEKIIPPHIVTCKICNGTGICNEQACLQCSGSGRVIVTSTVVTYVTAYFPEVLDNEKHRL